MASIHTILRMIRPANVLTALADVMAGVAIAGYYNHLFWEWPKFLLLSFSTMCLYAGGIVFNDIFDRNIDQIERPERALPGKAISLQEAHILGISLLIAGNLLGFLVNVGSGFIALSITGMALLYNRYSKHHAFFGPLNMGLCRGLNLLLGISILPALLPQFYFLALVPILYIFSITMISQGEVHGGNKNKLLIGAALYSVVIGLILGLSYTQGSVLTTICILGLFGFLIFRPLIKALKDPSGKNVGLAVKAGVISLIIMDAAWAAAFGQNLAAFLILLLLPLSIWLGKQFAVT